MVHKGGAWEVLEDKADQIRHPHFLSINAKHVLLSGGTNFWLSTIYLINKFRYKNIKILFKSKIFIFLINKIFLKFLFYKKIFLKKLLKNILKIFIILCMCDIDESMKT